MSDQEHEHYWEESIYQDESELVALHYYDVRRRSCSDNHALCSDIDTDMGSCDYTKCYLTDYEVCMFKDYDTDAYNSDTNRCLQYPYPYERCLHDGYVTVVEAYHNGANCYRALERAYHANSHARQLFKTAFDEIEGPITVSLLVQVMSFVLTEHTGNIMHYSSLVHTGVPDVRYVGNNMIHMDASYGTIPFAVLYAKLQRVMDMPMWVGMEAATMIAMSMSTNAANMASGHASKAFEAEVKAMPKVQIVLTQEEKRALQRLTGYCPLYENKVSVSHDHRVLAACRELIRASYDATSNSKNISVKTLVIGSSWREVSKYSANPNIDHYFFCGDGKDMVRTTIQALEEVVKQKWQNMKKPQRDNVRRFEAQIEATPTESLVALDSSGRDTHSGIAESIPQHPVLGTCKDVQVERFLGMKGLLKQAKEVGGMPGKFMFDVVNYQKDDSRVYSTLLFEDVGYNFSERNWLELFSMTNAMVGYGYMALPYELLFDHMPITERPVYRYSESTSWLWERTFLPEDGSARPWKIKKVGAAMSAVHTNGYEHGKDAWSLIMRKPLWTLPGFNFALEVEITARVGPMAAFTISRRDYIGTVVRTIALPEDLEYVRVMDLVAVADRMKIKGTYTVSKPYPYLSVRKAEVLALQNYLLSLDAKSLDMTNAMAYVRKMQNGASLVEAKLAPKWDLKSEHLHTLVVAVYHNTVLLRSKISNDVAHIVQIEVDWWAKIKRLMQEAANLILEPMSIVWSWIYTSNLSDQLILDMPNEHHQRVECGYTVGGMQPLGRDNDFNPMFHEEFFVGKERAVFHPNHIDRPDIDAKMTQESQNDTGAIDNALNTTKVGDVTYVDFDFSDSKYMSQNKLLSFLKAGGKLRDDKDLHWALLDYYNWRGSVEETSCPTCLQLQGKTGKQIVECYHTGVPTKHKFGMTQVQICDLRNKLKQDSVSQPAGLAKLFEEVHKVVPQSEFEVEAEVEFIKGGPGCGKSYIIRALADPLLNLIVCPYLKVRSDYQQVMIDGKKEDYRFHTQHKACLETGSSTIYVDEFTAMDYQLLSIIVMRCGATKVVIVGDEQQTGILESNNEGVNITNVIDIPTLNRHEPIVNFRNPAETVRLLNYLYGYLMIPASDSKGEILFGDTMDFQEEAKKPNTTFMHYTWKTHEILMCTGDNEARNKTTVRSNQGSTWDNVVLPITTEDTFLITNESLNVVALSRHKGNLTIQMEGGEMCRPDVNHLRQMITGVPDAVHRRDYVLRTYLGLEHPRDSAPKREETALRKEFRELLELYDGYVPYDVEIPSPPEVITELVVDELPLSSGGIMAGSEASTSSGTMDVSPVPTMGPLMGTGNVHVDGTTVPMPVCEIRVEGVHSGQKPDDTGLEMCKMESSDSESDKPLMLQMESVPGVKEWRRKTLYTINNRPNNCLAVALSNSLQMSRTSMDNKMRSKDFNTAVYYHDWLDSDRMSSILDVCAFAKSLGITVKVKLENGDPLDKSDLSCGVGGELAIIRFDAKEKHYYYNMMDRKQMQNTTLFNFSMFKPKEIKDKELVVDHIWKLGPTLSEVMDYYDTDYAKVAELNGWKDNKQKLVCGSIIKFAPSNKKIYGIDTREGGRVSDSQVLMRIDPDTLTAEANDYNLRHTFLEYVNEFVPRSIVSHRIFEVPNLVACAEVKHPKPPRDAYLLTAALDYNSTQHYDLDFLNQETQTIVGKEFVAGTVDLGMLTPVNQRGHPKTDKLTYRTLTTGPANVYLGKSQYQTLQVMQARYLSKATSSYMTVNGINTAKYIADLFVAECLDPDLSIVLDDENLATVQRRAYADMEKRHYQKQMNELDQAAANVCRFQLKDIEKVAKDAIHIGKAGQGIAAWSKLAQTKFMLPFRLLNQALLDCLKPNVVYDNSYSEEEFMRRANHAMASTPLVAVNGVIDATACDAGQNAFTQLIERYIMKSFGISDGFLDRYFSFRESYILQSEHIRAPVKNIKTSGEPGTLYGNSILMAAMMNALLRGEGPSAILMKGDDGVKRQANLVYNPMLVKAIRDNCSLDFKLDIDVPMQFCGYSLTRGMLVPCVERKLAKIATHKFKTYEHFSEYQESLRDWIKRVPTDPVQNAIFMSANAEVSGISYELVDHLFSQIVSFSRIGREQFETQFKQRTVTMDVQPVDYSEGKIDMDFMKFSTSWAKQELGKKID